MNPNFANKLTYETLRFIYAHDRQDYFARCNSPEEVEKLLLDYLYYNERKTPSVGFLKGFKLCNTKALYEYFKDRNSEALSEFAYQLLQHILKSSSAKDYNSAEGVLVPENLWESQDGMKCKPNKIR